MPFPIYLPVVLFFAVNAPIRSQYIGIIRTASIGSPSNSSGTYASQSGVVDCNRCVCRASQDAQIVLLTCTQIQPTIYSCQFYAQMPRLEDIQYPVNDTTVLHHEETARSSNRTIAVIRRISWVKSMQQRSRRASHRIHYVHSSKVMAIH